MRAQGLNVAFGDFSRIWDVVMDVDGGFERFGYISNSSCLPPGATTTALACADPEHTFYWISGWVAVTVIFPGEGLTLASV